MSYCTIPVGPLGTNCYLVQKTPGGMLYIIDPGAEPQKILAAVEEIARSGVRILLTHAHIDHFSAAGAVAAATGADHVELAPADHALYNSPENEIYPYFRRAEDRPEARDFAPAGEFRILPLPGHSPGGSGFLFELDGVRHAFTGDTIFAGSIGRTDLWEGNFDVLINSIRQQILPLDEECAIHPGHGIPTTVGRERATNPYIN